MEIKKHETVYTYRKEGQRLTTGKRNVTYWTIEGDSKRLFRRKRDARQYLDGGEDLSVQKISLI